MTSEEWHSILTLMTIVILADKKVYKEEVDTFVASVKTLNETISPEIFMTEGMAFDWFKANRGMVSNMIVGPNVEKNIQGLIAKTQNVPGKKEIISAMQTIATADSDFHKSEESIIGKCAKGWKLAA